MPHRFFWTSFWSSKDGMHSYGCHTMNWVTRAPNIIDPESPHFSHELRKVYIAASHFSENLSNTPVTVRHTVRLSGSAARRAADSPPSGSSPSEISGPSPPPGDGPAGGHVWRRRRRFTPPPFPLSGTSTGHRDQKRRTTTFAGRDAAVSEAGDWARRPVFGRLVSSPPLPPLT